MFLSSLYPTRHQIQSTQTHIVNSWVCFPVTHSIHIIFFISFSWVCEGSWSVRWNFVRLSFHIPIQFEVASLLENHPVLFNFYCRLERIKNHLGDVPLQLPGSEGGCQNYSNLCVKTHFNWGCKLCCARGESNMNCSSHCSLLPAANVMWWSASSPGFPLFPPQRTTAWN